MEKLNIHGRVWANTAVKHQKTIEQQALENMDNYSTMSSVEITYRLEELMREWDVERALEVNASAIGLAGLALGAFVDRRWLVLTGVVTGFLLQHGIQGWCPPLPLFRSMGIRTRQEIDEEIYALKALRGDFNKISSSSEPEEIIRSFRK